MPVPRAAALLRAVLSVLLLLGITLAGLSPNSDGTYSGTTVPVYSGSGTVVSNKFWQWYPVPDTSKWGGYFSVPLPPAGQTYTTPVSGANILIGCAGCAKNDKSKGYVAALVELAV
eukprot:XP_001691474.1 predicted protein [Chlamydomonas reinhardtii]